MHQKLYQSDELAMVNLGVYIRELANSISESFDVKNSVSFNINVVDANLSTAETVPIGLILNEAITNSVKYAFDKRQKGMITINLTESGQGVYQLIIRDNGKGLPTDFDITACSSLGMNLIIGLTEQLAGEAIITSDGGTIITIVFTPSAVTT